MTAVQEQLLLAEPAITRLAMSALDRAWLEAVPPGPAMVTAEGLFMYVPRQEVHHLVADVAARFGGGRLLFDSIPQWFSTMTMRGRARLTSDYVAPPMPHHQNVRQGLRLPEQIAGVATAVEVDLPLGRGPWASRSLRRLSSIPPLRDVRPSIIRLDLAGAPS